MEMEKSTVKELLIRFAPTRWPIVGPLFEYFVYKPAESLCLSYLLLVTIVMYGVFASIITETWNKTSIIIVVFGLLLTFAFFITGISVLYIREKARAERLETRREEEEKEKIKHIVRL